MPLGDYACLPVENSLGGSIHENYDLMLRYDLTIVAEHEFRVKHCLLAKPGVKRDDIKYAISHRKSRQWILKGFIARFWQAELTFLQPKHWRSVITF